MKFLFLNIIIVSFLFGCKQKDGVSDQENASFGGAFASSYSPLDYLSWIESSEGLHASKKIDKIDFQLLYMPKEYLVIRDHKDSLENFDEKKLLVASKNYEGLQYFKLRISIDDFHDEIVKYNIRSDFEYEDRVKYYSFGMQRSLKLIDGKDTLPCVLFNYERTFNLTPNSNFQIAFPASENKSSKTLVFEDVYLGTGKVMLTIPEEKIKSTPKIAF